MLRVGQEKLKLEQDMTTDEGECRHTNFFRPTGHREREDRKSKMFTLSPLTLHWGYIAILSVVVLSGFSLGIKGSLINLCHLFFSGEDGAMTEQMAELLKVSLGL